MTYQAKIIAGGKIVIPADRRRQLGFAEGNMLVVERVGETIVVESRSQVLREIQVGLKQAIKRPFTVDEFVAGRRAEAERE